MTFDDQLQRSFGTLSDHLRDEIARALHGVRTELGAQADAARDAAVTDASTRVRTQAEAAARVEIDRIEQRARELAAAAAAHEQARAAEAAAHQRLVAGVRAIDGARSLSDILDTLIICASGEAARVAILLAHHGELHGWRLAGFEARVDPPSVIVIPAGTGGILDEAMRSGGAVTSAGAGAFAPPAFAALPGHRACFAMPITIRNEAVALLYADDGAGAERDAASGAPPWPDALEVFARHATRCLEAATAIKAVGVLTDAPDVAPAPVAVAAAPPSPGASTPPQEMPPDEESAQRYARLLVSEIKLYNESAVVAGRYVRDLRKRLAPEIARARDLYEQQIPPEARTIDHFQNELVRTLANGDASLLGPTP